MEHMRGIAYVNHGRWMVDCPACGSPVVFDPQDGPRAVCGACHPELFAVKYIPAPDGSGAFNQVADEAKRRAARAHAFRLDLPPEWQDIMDALQPRHASNMNWLPGESVEQLRAQNRLHGV